LYKKVLLAYDGSIEGRRALREGARIAQLCGAEVSLLAVAEISAATAAEVGFAMPITEQVEIFEKILAEGVQRLKAMGFTPTASLSIGEAGREIAKVAAAMGANLVVVGHRADGPLAGWFSSVGTYLVRNLRCSVLIAQTEIGDEEFAQLLSGFAVDA
jgi:nucleotide-binding universal stress UspA family protein